ncbi:MAG: OmpH family outer membrane protein [Alphaproteobacteria bacterium]|nr:OmpH family outer membrane protein [Alphaproteobacteria bacterium]
MRLPWTLVKTSPACPQKRFIAYLRIFLLLLAGLLILAANALAEPPAKMPEPIIAIVDVQRILQESLASKGVQKQLEVQRSKFQNEIEKEENSLRKAEQDLAAQRSKLSAQVYAEREQQLRQRFLTVENHVQSRRKVLDQSFTDSMNAVKKALLDIVSEVSHERGVNLVIVKQQALWTDQPLDVTDEVLARLDKKIPKIDVVTLPEKPEK